MSHCIRSYKHMLHLLPTSSSLLLCRSMGMFASGVLVAQAIVVSNGVHGTAAACKELAPEAHDIMRLDDALRHER